MRQPLRSVRPQRLLPYRLHAPGSARTPQRLPSLRHSEARRSGNRAPEVHAWRGADPGILLAELSLAVRPAPAPQVLTARCDQLVAEAAALRANCDAAQSAAAHAQEEAEAARAREAAFADQLRAAEGLLAAAHTQHSARAAGVEQAAALSGALASARNEVTACRAELVYLSVACAAAILTAEAGAASAAVVAAKSDEALRGQCEAAEQLEQLRAEAARALAEVGAASEAASSAARAELLEVTTAGEHLRAALQVRISGGS